MASDFCLSSGFGVPVMCLRNCYGVDCDLDLDCDLMHQPTHLGREPRVCTAGRAQMLSLALR